jgi:hypothetical protein
VYIILVYISYYNIILNGIKTSLFQTYNQSHVRVHLLHRFEHGLLHVHVRVLRHAHLLLSFLVPQFTRVRTYRSCSFYFPFRHGCSRVRIGVVLNLKGCVRTCLLNAQLACRKFSPLSRTRMNLVLLACIACSVNN